MKKLIFALGLLLSGVVGFKVQPGANSTVFGCIHGIDLLVLVLFAALSLVGLLLAIRSAASPD